jgi:hypothetical protein
MSSSGGIARWDGPPRQVAAAQVEMCAPCHARSRPIVADPLPGARFLDTHASMLLAPGDYHADGQIQGEVFEWGSFAQSRMQHSGVVCADCHDPHSGRLCAEGNTVCAQCHLPARFDVAEHHRHAPGGAGAECVACHMPAVSYTGVDRRRDHAFSIPCPDVTSAIGAPDTCTSCHARQAQDWAAAHLVFWHGAPRGASQQNAMRGRPLRWPPGSARRCAVGRGDTASGAMTLCGAGRFTRGDGRFPLHAGSLSLEALPRARGDDQAPARAPIAELPHSFSLDA